MLLTRPHHRFSVADYDRMIESGILTKDDRVELIRGEILKKMSIGELHAATVCRLNRYFSIHHSDNVLVGVQRPIRLIDSEPEPDTVLLKLAADFYASGKPTAQDVFLLIEVADSSLEIDRELKSPIYAENGIVEYWIVNLIDRKLEVFRQPQPDGTYHEKITLSIGEVVEPVSLPGAIIPVAELFGLH